MSKRAQWTELEPGAEASYFKVRCACGFEEVKASKANVQHCMRGHSKRCAAPSFTITPMQRTEVAR